MKIVFNKNGGHVTMSQEEGVALRNKIINDLTWQKYLSDASHYIQRSCSNINTDAFVWKSGFDVAEEHNDSVYLFNKDKYWCRAVVVMEKSGAIKVFAECDGKNTLSGHRVYIEDGDVLYTDKDEAIQNSRNDEDSFREVKSDLENAYNNFKDNVQKAGTVVGGLLKELADTANSIASDVATKVSEHIENVMDEFEAKKNTSKDETSSDNETNEKDSVIDKTIRFYKIINLKARLTSLNKKKADVEIEIEKIKKQIDDLEKESV